MKHVGTERLGFERSLARLPVIEAHLRKILARLERFRPVRPGAKVADVGAAQGLFLIAAAKAGLNAVGVEPAEPARELAGRLADHEGVGIDIRPGCAEQLPLESGEFDFVHAISVVEHARDPQAAFDEAHRVLAAGGVLWFATASSMCPRQHEIGRFPCFGWYPDRLKRRIMAWARANRPELIGHTQTPAMHWFTPAKARRMLAQAGFGKVYDRWDIRLPAEGGRLHRAALGFIRSCRLTKLLGEIMVPHCSYAAVK